MKSKIIKIDTVIKGKELKIDPANYYEISAISVAHGPYKKYKKRVNSSKKRS